jgi:hypothetical protein
MTKKFPQTSGVREKDIASAGMKIGEMRVDVNKHVIA